MAYIPQVRVRLGWVLIASLFIACFFHPAVEKAAVLIQSRVDSIPESWKEEPVILLADSVRIDFKNQQNANGAVFGECCWYYINKRNPTLLNIINIYDDEYVESAPYIAVDVIFPDGRAGSISSRDIRRFRAYDEGEISSSKMENQISISQYQEKMLIRLLVVRNYKRPAHLNVEYLRNTYHCLHKSITLSWPSDVRLNYVMTNHEGLIIDTSLVTSKTRNAVTMRGSFLPKFPVDQKLRYPEQWFAGLHVSLPPSGKHSVTWQELGDDYLEMIKTSLASSPEIKRQAASLNDIGREAIVRKTFQFVQKNIRYVADEEKKYSIVPRPATEILAKGYGDCKEMVVLLKALLEEKGVQSSMALVASKGSSQVLDTIPTLGEFDHVILYVPEFDRSSVFLDPTVDYGKVENSYYYCMHQKAFIMEKGRSRLCEILPREGEGLCIVRTSSEVDSAQDGSWVMRGTVVLKDYAAFQAFSHLKELKGEENNPALINLLNNLFTIEPVSVSCKQQCTDSVTIGFSCNVSKNHLKIDKGGILLEMPSIYGGPSVFTTIKREGPRVFEQLDQKDSWVLPEGFDELESTPFVHRIGSGAWDRKGRVFSRTFTMSRVIVPASQAEESKQFLRQKDSFFKATVWHN